MVLPTVIFKLRSFFNMVWRYTYCFAIILNLIFVAFLMFHFLDPNIIQVYREWGILCKKKNPPSVLGINSKRYRLFFFTWFEDVHIDSLKFLTSLFYAPAIQRMVTGIMCCPCLYVWPSVPKFLSTQLFLHHLTDIHETYWQYLP